MNTSQPSAHEPWEELAAGYALHALEPDEEGRFLSHLEGCAHCRQTLDDHAFVAAQLGSLADAPDLTPPSWSSIRRGVIDAGPPLPRPATEPAAVVPLDGERRRRRPPRLLGAAAGVVLLAGTGTLAWQLAQPDAGSTGQPAAIARCEHAAGCHVVKLPEGDPEAVVLADATRARFLPTGLATPAAGHVYALWQMPRDGRPILVTVLPGIHDGVAGPSTDLALPYADTAAFAISVEPEGSVPTKPTRVVAVGTAPV